MKTANKMFERLGYTRVLKSKGVCVYENEKEFYRIKLRSNGPTEQFVEKGTIGSDLVRWNLTFDELLACAKLIEEMEKQND